MTALTREQVEAMLAGATPDWLIYSEPEVGLPPSLFAGKIMEGVNPIEPLIGADLTLAASAPDLATALLAAWDREAKLREALKNIDAVDPEAMIDGFSEYATRGLVLCMGAIARAALGETP